MTFFLRKTDPHSTSVKIGIGPMIVVLTWTMISSLSYGQSHPQDHSMVYLDMQLTHGCFLSSGSLAGFNRCLAEIEPHLQDEGSDAETSPSSDRSSEKNDDRFNEHQYISWAGVQAVASAWDWRRQPSATEANEFFRQLTDVRTVDLARMGRDHVDWDQTRRGRAIDMTEEDIPTRGPCPDDRLHCPELGIPEPFPGGAPRDNFANHAPIIEQQNFVPQPAVRGMAEGQWDRPMRQQPPSLSRQMQIGSPW